ncbi:MAG: TonB-dependent receptor [Flavobacteriaceae bacterium]|jgi:outer membrane receptor for ferrienterochelin and colicins|nr:TonB-dependent receptor [Flavobacteriaceae bacterium]
MIEIKLFLLTICMSLTGFLSFAQNGKIKGKITDNRDQAVETATVSIPKLNIGTTTDSTGTYQLDNIPYGSWKIEVRSVGFNTHKSTILLNSTEVTHNVMLGFESKQLEEVVVTGTLKEVRKSESPVPVTIISSKLFRKTPTSNVLDALYLVNGLNPQVNCNMCNTSDIGINGMQGPYSMVLIDGMPIVSSLSTVYGLSGIPNTVIDRVEIVKGPASSLYGSEAMGGVINIITKKSSQAPRFFLDYNGSTWGELTGNTGFSVRLNDKISTMFNVDGYYYNTPKDQDKDGYTDKTLQNRTSFFNKWDFKHKSDKISSISLRYYNENRHGGELGWNKNHRGFVDFNELDNNVNSDGYNGDYVLPNGYTIYNSQYAKGFRIPRFKTNVEKEAWKAHVRNINPNAVFADDMKYQESIYTSRFEAVGRYQLPIEENVIFNASYNQHDQNSAYGTELFMAHQKTLFGQGYWDKELGSHNLLTGVSFRYIWFKDNTIASDNGNFPLVTKMPGIFIQDLWKTGEKTSLLLGYRFDYDVTASANGNHKNRVHSPRAAFKYIPNSNNTFRASVGTGYRVANIFSEDHRALSGQYRATFGEDLKPERSLSGTLDYEGRIATESIGLTYSLGGYYTHFFNKVYPIRNDAEHTLVYYNVDGDEYAENIGASLDIALNFSFPLRITTGVSYNKAQLIEYERDEEGNKTGGKTERNDFEFSPRWMGVYSVSYDFTKKFTLDLTGEWKGPMLLPTQGEVKTYDGNGKVTGSITDPRSERSPWFTKINLQLTCRLDNGLQFYAGVKNIFDYVPKNLLVNVKDPFSDLTGTDGGLQFDTEYNYTPQQGRTGFAGLRYSF